MRGSCFRWFGVLALCLMALPSIAFGHAGGRDAYGGHKNSSYTDGKPYECHACGSGLDGQRFASQAAMLEAKAAVKEQVLDANGAFVNEQGQYQVKIGALAGSVFVTKAEYEELCGIPSTCTGPSLKIRPAAVAQIGDWVTWGQSSITLADGEVHWTFKRVRQTDGSIVYDLYVNEKKVPGQGRGWKWAGNEMQILGTEATDTWYRYVPSNPEWPWSKVGP